MSNILEKTKLTFDKLGVSSEEAVDGLFRELTSEMDFEVKAISTPSAAEEFRIRWLGRNNSVSVRLRENWLKPAPPDAKKWIGKALNAFLVSAEGDLNNWKDSVKIIVSPQDQIDLSLPGAARNLGSEHLVRQTYEELCRIFGSIGFSVVEGPEIETAYYNFEALNIPEYHPARDNMDTFYIGNAPGYLLRTHTSPMQARMMEKQQPPVRIVVPGKVYRRDNPDATHSFMFHQLEGLAVDTDITFCDFKGTIEYFAKEFFGPQTRVRLRPSYFPFTEPSAEFDASCHVCGGKGCRTCKQSGWIEMFGAGMVNPAVYGFVNYDPRRYSGFAFGLGVDRLAMLKYGIDDLQQFFRNDVRFLRQFS
jgi:phenylalanyl-tRNA synthetase alpha chain